MAVLYQHMTFDFYIFLVLLDLSLVQCKFSISSSEHKCSACAQVEELRSNGLEPYAYKWDRTHSASQLQEIYKNLGNGEESKSENDYVSISGRIVARRAFGKLAFLTLRDDSGMIQVFIFAIIYLLFFALGVLFGDNLSTSMR